MRVHTTKISMDPYGHLKKSLGSKYAHLHNVEKFWENFQDDNEVRMRQYMRIQTYFLKRVNLFLIPDQVEEDEDTIMDPR